MILSDIELQNLRILRYTKLSNFSEINIVTGKNGSGKSSFLEALFILGRGRSYRSNSLSNAVTNGADLLRIVGTIKKDNFSVNVGLEFNAPTRKTQIRIAGKTIQRSSELTEFFPLLLINPNTHRLLEMERARRRLLDWLLFHVEPRFKASWQAYTRALDNRNSALKLEEELSDVWIQSLDKYGTELDELRNKYIKLLNEKFNQLAGYFPNFDFIELDYFRGWNRDKILAEQLHAGKFIDIKYGYTRHGPHRADLKIKLNGKPYLGHASSGEQKISAICLFLSMAGILYDTTQKRTTLLIDDLAAELDTEHRQILLKIIKESNSAAFITCNDRNTLEPHLPSSAHWFHVEQGVLTSIG